MHYAALAALIVAGLNTAAAGEHATSPEWTRFRGPNGSGVSAATGIPLRWTDDDYLWKVKLPGIGHSSPVLWGERLFITSGDEATGTRMVLCFDATTGQRQWAREFAGSRHRKHADNSLASATPAVDAHHVYVCWGTPEQYLVVALDHDGHEKWRADLGPFRGGHGFGASPIVHEDILVVPNDQDGASTIVGLDCTTGTVRWKVPRRSKASYATPCIYRPPGRPAEVIVTSYEHGITSIDPKTGRVSWEVDVFDKRHVETPIGSPIVAGDLVLATCGWLGVRQEVVAVRPVQAEHKGPAQEVYRLTRNAPLCTAPLVKDDLLFLWSDGGVVTCADVRTGAVHWRERVPGSYYGSPVCVGEHLYAVNRSGDMVVLAAAKRFALLARNALGEGSHSTPAVANGRLYLRTFSHLMAVGGKEPKNRTSRGSATSN
jgi:outer membrane protein assembly factor BamB